MHAIINWMCHLLQAAGEKTFHLNDAARTVAQNPIEVVMAAMECDVMVSNTEDMFSDEFVLRWRKHCRAIPFDDGAEVSTITIIRDIRNLFASRNAYSETCLLGDVGPIAEECWRDHVLSPGHKIIFDRWASSPVYREQVCQTLGIPFSKKVDAAAMDYVPGFGGGSSFDGMSYSGRGSEMDVLSRWDPWILNYLSKSTLSLNEEFVLNE